MNPNHARIRVFVLLAVLLAGLSGCVTAPDGKGAAPSVQSVAVWDLENFGDVSAADWGEVLSASIVAVFEESGRYTIVEREQLVLALEELHLGSSALADEGTRLRIGKIVGARFMVFGGYIVMGGRMRLDIRLVEVESGRVLRAAAKTASAPGLAEGMTAARAAAGDILPSPSPAGDPTG
ncbi:CsgG/HfaB family protein [Desulfococcus sp.]|uniref:CsgG/HfaB family protein n=1 Tax=Desulfococcus sp. TaxID=2025834 RepID=UPI003593395D